ncbi:MAG: fluoride efflux transporter CrcB [Paracoccaceae bacterium]
MMWTVTLVAMGGALGSVLRFLWGLGVVRLTGPSDFPFAIVSVNILGSFLMGVFVVTASVRGLTPMSPFVMTGLLGGFTTFSAFSLETITLIERGHFGLAVLYIGISVGVSVAALALGIWLARGIFA